MKEIHVKLGEVLKLERERRKIAIEDASDQLKISQANLEYVENGEIEHAPSTLYFSMFAKSYAEFLGIDYNATLDAIKDELGVLETDPQTLSDSSGSPKEGSAGPEKTNAESNASDASGISKKLLNWFGIFVLAFICVLLVWIFVFDDGDDSIISDTDDPSSDSLVDQSINSAAQTNEPGSMSVNYEYGTPPSSAADPIQFRMVASAECWATILADGDTAIFRNLIPGRQYEVQANYRLRISIANPGVVQTFINNTEVDLRNPETRRISRVVVNQINLSQVITPTVIDTTPVEIIMPPSDSTILTTDTATVPPPAPRSNPSPEMVPTDTLNKDSTGDL